MDNDRQYCTECGHVIFDDGCACRKASVRVQRLVRCWRCREDASVVEWRAEGVMNYIIRVRRKSKCKYYGCGNTTNTCSTKIHNSFAAARREWESMQASNVRFSDGGGGDQNT